jgi:hypothetical protein
MIYRSVLQINFYPAIQTKQIFHYKEITGLCTYEVQMKENYGQSGFGKFLDAVLNNYGKLIAM